MSLGPGAASELHRFRSALSYRQGEYARALTDAEQALALLEQARGPQDVALAESLAGMGRALNGLGRYADAERHYARALALTDAVYGQDHLLRAVHLSNVATALRLQGRVAEAVAMSTRLEVPPLEHARARFALARVLWRTRAERPRALSLAREALEAYSGGLPLYAQRVREVQAWLSAHGHS